MAARFPKNLPFRAWPLDASWHASRQQGIGALVANSVCPYLLTEFTKDKIVDFRGLFLVPLGASLVGALALAFLFHPPKKQESQSAERAVPGGAGH